MKRSHSNAFSLVEVLAAIAIIGIITFLALPNIVRIKQDSEENLAIARAEALNLAVASYIQANGQTTAATRWGSDTNSSTRYQKLAPYLAYAPADLADYMPSGYSISLPSTLLDISGGTLKLSKVPVTFPSGVTLTNY